jgi:hypothetical protein
MNLYLVRIIDTKEILGIFFDKDHDDLCWSIDEFMNPNECEYAELEIPFSMVWLQIGTPKEPKGHFEDSDYEEWNFDGMSFGEYALGFLAELEDDEVEFKEVMFNPY